MSRFFYQISKNQTASDAQIKAIATRILPKNTCRREIKTERSGDGREVLAIFNPTAVSVLRGRNLAIGSVFEIQDSELNFGAEKPASFSFLLRTNDDKTEAFSDLLCSKTVWYFFDNQRFIVSDSQRILTALIGDFQLNEQAVSWMLATGTTGPGYAWDKRFKAIGHAGELIFDKKNWTLEHRTAQIPFEKTELPDEVLAAEIRRILEDEFSKIKIDPSFFLTLSGGTDSRLITALLGKFGKKVTTITWGIPEKQAEPNGDIFLARKTAEMLGFENRFMPVGSKFCDLDFGSFLEKFLQLGEGRIDQLSGYLDGFKIWETLDNQGFAVNIRGDEVFGGRQKLYSENHLRQLQTLHGLEVYDNFKPLPAYDLPDVEIPEYLSRNGDSMETWRDRLFNYANLGTVQASLNDIKYPFVDLINPLLLNELVLLTRKFSDKQRTAKILFGQSTKTYVPDLPTAFASTMPPVFDIFKMEKSGEQVAEILNDSKTRSLVGEKLLREISPEKINVAAAPKRGLDRSLKRKIRNLVPHSLLKIFKNQKAEILPPQRMVLRVCLVRTAVAMYESDAMSPD